MSPRGLLGRWAVGKGSLGERAVSGVEDCCRGLENPVVIAAAVVLGVSSCPLRLIPSRLPNPFTFQREGVSEVAQRSPDRHLSISNHLPPSAPQVCQKRLQDRAPPFHVW